MKNATDAVGIVLKELKRQSSLGIFHLLVAVDGVNALWGRTTLKREDKSPVGKPSLYSGFSDFWYHHIYIRRLGRSLADQAIYFLAPGVFEFKMYNESSIKKKVMPSSIIL